MMKTLLSRLLLCAVAMSIACGLSTVSAQTRSRSAESKRARLEKEIQIIDAQLKEISSKSSKAMSNLSLTRKKIEKRNELIAESDTKITSLASEIESKQLEVNLLKERFDTLSDYYTRLVRNAYKNRDAKVWYMYVLSSDNISQAVRRMGYLRTLSARMNEQAEKIKETRAQLETETAQLEDLKSETESLKAKRLDEVTALKAEEAQSQTLVNKLKKDKKRYQNDLAAKRQQMEALNRQTEKMIRNSTGGSSAGKSSSKTKIDYTLDSEFAKNKGKLPWPADGPVVEQFGQHNHPVYTNVQMPFSNGIGIAVGKGSQVKAVFNGTVKQVIVMPGYSKCVLVQHGNYFSFYCKLASVSVKSGDKVKTGQVIGIVDTIDGETQLHFQIWKGTAPQNPESWLR